MKAHILGVDLTKNVFQLHGVDRKERSVLTRRVRREQLLKVLGELEPYRHRSLDWCILLAAAVREARSRREDYGPAVREAVRAPAEERYQRRRGDLHGRAATEHAVRAEEDAGAAGYPGAPPCAAAVGQSSNCIDQPDARTFARPW